MVRQIKAYQAEDGSIFADKQEAARHDAKTRLKKLFTNEAFVNEVLNNHSEIFDVLAPLNIGIETAPEYRNEKVENNALAC